MNNDFKAGIIGGLVFLGILLCLGLVENTLESSSDKKASPYSRYSYTPNYGTSKRSSYANDVTTDEKDIVDLDSEGYPLVMDAPLSAFDKTRILNICDALPRIADQVIIFIKDTDGEIAEQYLGDKVGKRYLINKDNNLNSTIEAR